MKANERFLENVYRYVCEEHLICAGDIIAVGVSGGADSVALLISLCQLKERLGIKELIAVHVNHQIRGEEAICDQNFVIKLCEDMGVECKVFTRNIPAYAKTHGLSLEEAGRCFRYECFDNVLRLCGCTKIAVAHNRNDLVETVIFNMVRGSGLKGISGIPARRGTIIRPLLFSDRRDIEAYLFDIGQSYQTDSTNISIDYDRNKIRHIVLPALLEINDRALLHIAALAGEAGASYESIKKNALQKVHFEVASDGGGTSVALNIDEVLGADRQEQFFIIYEAITEAAGAKKDITRKNVESVIGLLNQDTGKKLDLPYNMTARRSYDTIIISRRRDKEQDYEVWIDGAGDFILPNEDGILKVWFMNVSNIADMGKNNYTKAFNCDKIKSKLCIRLPKEGDYITINTEGGSKKLSRIFIDNKIDREKRKTWPVLAMGNEVLWAVGLRYNEAYRVDPQTKKVMYCEVKYTKGEIDGRKGKRFDKRGGG